jgi:hypothetical protein
VDLPRPALDKLKGGTHGQRVQDVDRIANIQPFTQPTRTRCSGVDVEASGHVLRLEGTYGVIGHRRRNRNIGKQSPIGPPELQRAGSVSIDPKTLLVDSAMMAATQQREVRERRRPSLRPVANVMALAER